MKITEISKITAATLLAFTVMACSSGGSHSSSSNSTLVNEQAAAEKAAAEKAAAEKAAAEKAAAEKAAAEKAAAEKAAAEKAAAEKAAAEKAAAEKAAAEKAAAEKAAAEKAAAEKAAAEKAAAEKAAAEKAAAEKAAAEKAAAEKAAAEKAAAEKAAAEKAAAEKAAAEKAAAEKAAAEKAAAEKAAAEKAAAEKAAAEKAAAEKAAIIEANRLILLTKAKEAGLNEQQASEYAENNKESDEATAKTALSSIIANNERSALLAEASVLKNISNSLYPIDTVTAQSSSSASSTSNSFTQESRIQSVVYNQPYSVVLGRYSGNISYNNQTGAIISDNRTSNIEIRGLKTALDAIPSLGVAKYTGKAFNGVYTSDFDWNTLRSSESIKQGVLSYKVDFKDRIGSGSITGLGSEIILNQGTISGTGISSSAQQSFNTGNYTLDFYGKKAEEIAGKVQFNGRDTVGFGGTRGEISK